MRIKSFAACLFALLMLFSCVLAEAPQLPSGLEPLPMDTIIGAPQPLDEGYISDTEYEDESLSVKIYRGRYADSDYVYAHVKISHPSQLRTAPASILYNNPSRASFHQSSTGKGRIIAKNANAVVALNGDYYTKSDVCHIVLRQGTQYRNFAIGLRDLLIIDKNGDFSYMREATKEDYSAYYEAHKDELYQVFSFGPVLVENGVSAIAEDYQNSSISAHKPAQRSAIAQLGPLEYALITSYGNQTKGNKGMTIYEFAAACELIGKELSEDGFQLAFNLDGGNSSTLMFRTRNKKGQLEYTKVNCPEIERMLSDIIYFATLVK